MYILKVINILNSNSFFSEFKTAQEASDWLQSQVINDSFGKPARQAVRGQDEFDESLVLSEFQDTDIDGTVRTIVSLKAEYTIDGPRLIDGTGITDDDKKFRMESARKKIAIFRVFKDFGLEVELLFTALINERSYTQAQKDSLQVNASVGAVLNELKFGRISKAKGLVDAMVADNNLFFEADLQVVSKHMEDFLLDYV